MKKDITLFINRTSHEQGLIKKFTELVKSVKTKTQMRELEMRLLRPRPLRRYKGKRPGQTAFKKRCMMLTFKSNSVIKAWARHFKVNTYVENNTYDVDFLVELFRLMDDGQIKWDSKKKKYEINMFEQKRKIKRRRVNKRKIKRRKK